MSRSTVEPLIVGARTTMVTSSRVCFHSSSTLPRRNTSRPSSAAEPVAGAAAALAAGAAAGAGAGACAGAAAAPASAASPSSPSSSSADEKPADESTRR